MFALMIAVCCCSLAAAAADGRTRKLHATVDENAADAWRYHAATVSAGRSCCGGGGGSSSTASAVTDEDARSSREIPLSVIKELNQVKNVSELFTKFMPEVNTHAAQKLVATTGFQSRTAINLERKAALMPRPAGCSIEIRTISLKDTDDPSLYYYPPCTKVNRCGGCCSHDLMACQPTKLETLNFEVQVSQYSGEGKFEYLGRKSVTIVQHAKCKCDCIVKAENCNQLQSYNQEECRCECNNEEDYEKCNEEHNIKLWNPATCTCQCRDTQECTEGFEFDYNTCKCEPLRTKSKNVAYEFNKNRYSLDGH